MSPAPLAQLSDLVSGLLTLRTDVRAADIDAVRRIVESTGFFSEAEVAVAVELIEDRVQQGSRSDYRFIFADVGSETIAYACYGPIACTVGSFDLYWIAVDKERQSGGIGRTLLHESERMIAGESGRRVYVETSSRAQYEPTRQFYLRCGYHVEATLQDFYAPGDGKVILAKTIDAGHSTGGS